MRKMMSLICIAVLMMIAPASAAPDLIVESVTTNCGYLFGNESNTISASIMNNGTADAPASNADFMLSDGYSETVSVSALDAGNSTTVSITDPTIRNAGDSVTITVTADCNGGVTETNESNNVTTLDVTVVNNGYKGKTYAGGPNMTTWKTYDLNGDLVYSAGDSRYESGSGVWTHSNVTWTASDLPVSDTATVKDARLYVPYCWAKDGAMPNNYSMTFNGHHETFDAHYWDDKTRDYGTNYPYYGMLVYNVTANFSTSGNIANFTSLWSGLPIHSGASLRGMVLVAIYEDASELHRQIFVNEEFDLLYDGSDKCTTPEEATAWAPITGLTIDPSNVSGARLITFAPGADGSGSAGEGELIFNGQVWADEWNDDGVHQIGISDRDVTAHLQPTGNVVGFQSSADWMEASNAILILEEGDPLADSDSDGVPDCWDHEDDTPSGYLTDSEGRGYRIGDVNRDGQLTSVDALMILQAIVGNIEL